MEFVAGSDILYKAYISWQDSCFSRKTGDLWKIFWKN